MDELEYRVRWNSDESIAFENCSHIIKRNVTCVNKDPMLFQFSTDPRLKAGNMISIPKEDVLRLAPRIKVPVLLFKATQNSMLDKEGIKEEFEEVWEIVEMYSRDAEMIEVEGTHHLHLNTPRKVAAAVNEFLDKYYEPDYLAMHLERC